jgi:insertion element IS1 protein InsB
VSRLVRKTLSFSKKLENHVGAIWNFIHEYNRLIRERIFESEPNTIFSVIY